MNNFITILNKKLDFDCKDIIQLFADYNVVIFGSSVICSAINCENFTDYDIIIKDLEIIDKIKKISQDKEKIFIPKRVVFDRNYSENIKFIEELHELTINKCIFQFLYVPNKNITDVLAYSDLNINHNYLSFIDKNIIYHYCTSLDYFLHGKIDHIQIKVVNANKKTPWRIKKYLNKSPVFTFTNRIF
jgi:hypothetical protein